MGVDAPSATAAKMMKYLIAPWYDLRRSGAPQGGIHSQLLKEGLGRFELGEPFFLRLEFGCMHAAAAAA